MPKINRWLAESVSAVSEQLGDPEANNDVDPLTAITAERDALSQLLQALADTENAVE